MEIDNAQGVQAFVNASIATILVWLTVESHLNIVVENLSNIFSSKTFGLISYYLIARFHFIQTAL